MTRDKGSNVIAFEKDDELTNEEVGSLVEQVVKENDEIEDRLIFIPRPK